MVVHPRLEPPAGVFTPPARPSLELKAETCSYERIMDVADTVDGFPLLASSYHNDRERLLTIVAVDATDADVAVARPCVYTTKLSAVWVAGLTYPLSKCLPLTSCGDAAECRPLPLSRILFFGLGERKGKRMKDGDGEKTSQRRHTDTFLTL